ncbi:MAG: two-component system histidine kinase PnpS, partial [Candidatus Latescibacterota bacterium]
RNKRLLWQVFPYHVLIVLLSFLAVTLYAYVTFRTRFIECSRSDLLSKAILFQEMLSDQSAASDPEQIDALCKKAGRLVPARFTVILPSGRVVGDSMADPATMDNHGDRPEIIQALNGRTGVVSRFSFTLREPMVYVAIPLKSNNDIIAAVRTSFTSQSMNQTLSSFYLRSFLGGFVLVLLALSFSFAFSFRLNKTFREIHQGAVRLSSGELDYRIHVKSFAEIESLADALNGMADQLGHRIQTITAQRNELEAVLAGMTEAVIAIDSDERIINVNHSAESLFGISLKATRGRTIQETIRNTRFQNFVKNVLMSNAPLSEDNTLQFAPERTLQVHGTPLRDSGNRIIGAVIVLNDITRMKKLESMRKDFVANVSHELKTPITSIKGFVETLRYGSMRNQTAANRFLDIILKQTNRLNAIIEDLLSLSRLEQGVENESLRLETIPAKDIVNNVLQVCDMKAREKNISIDTSCSEDIILRVNPDLIEQAVVNLIDNAIKYSPPDSSISFCIRRSINGISIIVEDHGIGIPEKHLPRIFERFYRIDKSRSREMGGTGLGLSIVKHIVQVHNGEITVESTQGKGSTFILHFPI